MHAGIVESFFLMFAGAAVLAAVALYTRQPLLVAYIAVGGIACLHGLFLVVFFFSVGAAIHFDLLLEVAVPALVFALLMIALKPLVFRWLIGSYDAKVAWEGGVRLGQTSEFSLLVAYLGTASH